MPNTGTIHGGDIMLYHNTGTEETPVWTPFAHATSHTVNNGAMNVREVSSKQTGRFPTVKPGKHGISTIQIAGLRTYDGVDYFTLKTKKEANERIQVKLSGRPVADTDIIEVNEDSGDKYEEGFGYVTELSSENPHDGTATYSATITVDGKLDEATVA